MKLYLLARISTEENGKILFSKGGREASSLFLFQRAIEWCIMDVNCHFSTSGVITSSL